MKWQVLPLWTCIFPCTAKVQLWLITFNIEWHSRCDKSSSQYQLYRGISIKIIFVFVVCIVCTDINFYNTCCFCHIRIRKNEIFMFEKWIFSSLIMKIFVFFCLLIKINCLSNISKHWDYMAFIYIYVCPSINLLIWLFFCNFWPNLKWIRFLTWLCHSHLQNHVAYTHYMSYKVNTVVEIPDTLDI